MAGDDYGGKPQPVRDALAVLEEMAGKTAKADYAALAKTLPGFAMQLAGNGQAVDCDILRSYAEQGAETVLREMRILKTATAAKQKTAKTYEDILAVLQVRYVSPLDEAVDAEDSEKLKHALERAHWEPEDFFRAIQKSCEKNRFAELAMMTDGFVLWLTECTNHCDYKAGYYPGHAHAALIHALADRGDPADENRIRKLTADLLEIVQQPFEKIRAAYEGSYTEILRQVADDDRFLEQYGSRLMIGAAKDGYLPALSYLAARHPDSAAVRVVATPEVFVEICDGGHKDISAFLDENAVPYSVTAGRAVHMTPLYRAVAHGAVELLDYWRKTQPENLKPGLLLQGFVTAASNGQVGMLDYITAHFPDILTQEVLDTALGTADEEGELAVWRFLVSKGAVANYQGSYFFDKAATEGDLDLMKEMQAAGLDPAQNNGEALVLAAANGQYEIVGYLLDQGVSPRAQGLTKTNDSGEALARACGNGHYEVAKLLLERGAKPHDQFGNAMMDACLKGHTNIIGLLAQYGADLRVQGSENISFAVGRENGWKTIKYLKEEMGLEIPFSEIEPKIAMYKGYNTLLYYQEIGEIPPDIEQNYANKLGHVKAWRRAFGTLPPEGMEGRPVKGLKPDAFQTAQDILKSEGYEGKTANEYAYAAALLFGTNDRMLQYLEKWGAHGKQPFHDVVHKIRMPVAEIRHHRQQIGNMIFTRKEVVEEEAPFDVKSWGDAVLQHGPEMAKLVVYAGKMKQPARTDDGNMYSLNKTRAKVAEFMYSRGTEFPDLAHMCMKYQWHEQHFQTAVKLVEAFKEKYGAKDGRKPKNIPDITLDGEKFGMKGYSFGKLPDGDVRGLFLGEITDNCQHLAEAGAKCATHGYLSPQGGFYVLEDEKKNIVAQSWAWRGQNGELVLDSLESLGDRVAPKQWENICKSFAKEAAKKRKDIQSVMVGKSGETPQMAFNDAALPAVPVDYQGYRDSNRQYQIWQRRAGCGK
jgi:hypothetical protein